MLQLRGARISRKIQDKSAEELTVASKEASDEATRKICSEALAPFVSAAGEGISSARWDGEESSGLVDGACGKR